jgi:hypothetical protein
MKNAAIVSALFALATLSTASAQTANQDAQTGNLPKAEGQSIQVQPGNEPTTAMSQEVKPMDEDSAAKLNKEGEHPPTTRMGEAVPPMKPTDQPTAKD